MVVGSRCECSRWNCNTYNNNTYRSKDVTTMNAYIDIYPHVSRPITEKVKEYLNFDLCKIAPYRIDRIHPPLWGTRSPSRVTCCLRWVVSLPFSKNSGYPRLHEHSCALKCKMIRYIHKIPDSTFVARVLSLHYDFSFSVSDPLASLPGRC